MSRQARQLILALALGPWLCGGCWHPGGRQVVSSAPAVRSDVQTVPVEPAVSHAGGPAVEADAPSKDAGVQALAPTPYHLVPPSLTLPVSQHPATEPVPAPAAKPQPPPPTEAKVVTGVPPAATTQVPGAGVAKPAAAKQIEEEAWLTALRCLIEKRSGDAVQRLATYDKETQDLLLCLMPPVIRVGQGNIGQANAQELAFLMAQLESALAALRTRAALTVERMCYCRVIDCFGVYEQLPDQHPFRPGELVDVYVEVRNFTCRRRGPHHEVRLASSFQIKDGDRTLWPLKVVRREHVDQCQSARTDHYISYRFYVPENLRPGRYTLLLQLTDVPTQRTVEKTLDLRVTTRPGP